MASQKRSYAQKGQSSAPEGSWANIVTKTSFWQREPIETDEELEQRIAEYKNLCAERDHLPKVETLCLYLGIPVTLFKSWQQGVDCSERRKNAIEMAQTWILAVETEGLYEGIVQNVPYIWRSKQYHDMKEPNSDVNINIGRSPLKMLPTIEAIAAAGYLEDAETAEDDHE